jgi:hypothetical protein
MNPRTNDEFAARVMELVPPTEHFSRDCSKENGLFLTLWR